MSGPSLVGNCAARFDPRRSQNTRPDTEASLAEVTDYVHWHEFVHWHGKKHTASGIASGKHKEAPGYPAAAEVPTTETQGLVSARCGSPP